MAKKGVRIIQERSFKPAYSSNRTKVQPQSPTNSPRRSRAPHSGAQRASDGARAARNTRDRSGADMTSHECKHRGVAGTRTRLGHPSTFPNTNVGEAWLRCGTALTPHPAPAARSQPFCARMKSISSPPRPESGFPFCLWWGTVSSPPSEGGSGTGARKVCVYSNTPTLPPISRTKLACLKYSADDTHYHGQSEGS